MMWNNSNIASKQTHSFGKYSDFIIFSYTEDDPRTFGQLQLVNCSAINGQWLALEAKEKQDKGQFSLFVQN